MAVESKQPQQQGIKRELEAISERVRASQFKIKDLLVPLVTGVILILLGIFVYVPMIKAALNFSKESKEVMKKQQQLEELEGKLQEIDDEILQQDLLDAKVVIPKSLKVSSFLSYIEVLAQTKNLESRTLVVSDTQSTVSETKGDKRTYFAVGAPLTYDGSLMSILDFLDTLDTSSPYIISAKNIALRKTTEEIWKVTLNVMGYYIPEEEITKKTDLYMPFRSYLENKEVVEILKAKASQLNK